VRFLFVWGPVVLQMALIFAASSTSDPDPLPGRFLDKVAHLAVYAILGGLIARALSGGRFAAATWRHAAVAVVLSTLYGISDEWHQRFVPGRTPDAMDVVADAVGAAAGAAFFVLVGRMVSARKMKR
jgi:VanZ family protein